uniref:DSBA-like thioredoxin domain-containing protein n=1 Tax=Sinocyclocheilus anshuiensis TaxID=1608454 RepID=A0A671MI15_9TELE
MLVNVINDMLLHYRCSALEKWSSCSMMLFLLIPGWHLRCIMFFALKVVNCNTVCSRCSHVLILCFKVLCRYRNVWNIDLKFKPAYLTGVIYGSGNQPAGMNPSKLTYIVSDLTLLSEYFGVPMFRPSDLSDKGIQLQACFYGGRESSTRCNL